MDRIVVIQKAEIKDCIGIRRLIQELADYEKMPQGPKICHKTLEKHGFGERIYYRCLVAVDESAEAGGEGRRLVGYALYHLNFTWRGRTVYMEDLYVSPAFRSKGIGTKLWKRLLKDAMDEGACHCIFSVLDWNVPSLDFYKSKGAEDLTASRGYQTFRIGKHAIQSIAASDMLAIDVRQASGDLTSIVAAYREMANELGRAHELQITESAGLTSSPAWCDLLLATSATGELLGFLLYCLSYSTWEGIQLYVKDVYVKPVHRRSKIASSLLRSLMQRGEALGCGRCDMVVAAGQEAALEFFRHHQAVNLSEAEGWVHMMLERLHMEAVIYS
ncbi:hypothetical protein HAZT_HAZT004656 [Hyalella azteca]|uniref:N-acetyltransferase domain-containing protein n=1 Tax=Hyalella azteca TaxID=294128 RepID=A0A6A0GZ07_HYAAZ|nr:hypothetical protein HAZT_HAZT004656 [Hyalella azteca]